MKDYKNFENLSLTAQQQLVDKLFTEIDDRDHIEEVLMYLSLFTAGNSLKSIYPKLVEEKMFYPPEIYRHADHTIANELIKLIESDKENTNHLLICLAWIGTQNVIDFFIESSENKPPWTNKLYVLPKEYADQAGWVIDKNGNKRNLLSSQVKVLKNKSEQEETKDNFPTFVQQESNCPFCNGPLTKVFETEINKQTIEFTTCLLCSCYEPVFMKPDKVGNSQWHKSNKKWEHFDDTMEMEPIEQNALVLTNIERKPEYTINQFVEMSKSQIGGFPTWIQDAEYLNCPDCGEKMDFVGQIDMEDVEEYGEGLYYFHYCKSCNITGSNYQQT